MKVVLQMFWRMCLMRQSPEFVPTHNWFVVSVILANLLCSLLVALILDTQTSTLQIMTRLVVAQATNAALLWLALYLREFPDRFSATLTALFGCDLILTAVFGAVAPMVLRFAEQAITVLSLGFLVWSVAVAGFILHRALSVSLSIGIMVALGIMVLSISTSQIAIGG